MTKRIIRIDKADGSESVESRSDFIENVINKRNQTSLGRSIELNRFEAGEVSRISTAFAHYELRDVEDE